MKQSSIHLYAIRVLFTYFEYLEDTDLVKSLINVLTYHSDFQDLIHRKTNITDCRYFPKYGNHIHHLFIDTRFDDVFLSILQQFKQYPNIDTVTLNILDSKIEIEDINQYHIQNLEVITEWQLLNVESTAQGDLQSRKG